MQKKKAAEFIEDFDLYPRNNVDSSHIRSICEAMLAGVEFPPIIADKKSKRIVDGLHRRRAVIRAYGADAEIDVIEKSYKNDSEMFLEAMRYNAAHGAKLDSADRVHCAIIAERLSIPIEAVAGALNITTDKLANLAADRTATVGNLKVALKRTNRHFAGRKLTKRQREANERSSGMNQQFYVNQVIDLIESGFLDKEDDKLRQRLTLLYSLLEKLVGKVAA